MTREELFAYVNEKYGTEPEYLWSELPGYAVLRHKDNEKWYGIVMNVPKSKLGESDDETVIDIIDVKSEPEISQELLSKPGFRPGYHMNHKDWISVFLDGTVPAKEIEELIDKSFVLTEKG